MSLRAFPKAISLGLCWNLLFGLVAVRPSVSQEVTTLPKALNIVVDIQSEGAMNNIKTRAPREVIVSVNDENHKPVAGALVTFVLPDEGPSGTFLNGTKLMQATTDLKGQAIARGLRPNAVTGQYKIQVTASYNNVRTEAVINQTNVAAPTSTGFAGLSAKSWIIISSVAAGAAIGAGVAANKSGGSSGTTITAGTGSVGAPR